MDAEVVKVLGRIADALEEQNKTLGQMGTSLDYLQYAYEDGQITSNLVIEKLDKIGSNVS